MRKDKVFVAAAGAVLLLCMAAAAWADVFFAASNYANGSVGVISKAAGEYTVMKDLYVGLNGDARGFSFRGPNGAEMAMICERRGGRYDTIFLWEKPNWANPVFNRAAWGYNVHAAVSRGDYLYVATYERYQGGVESGGELIRVNMRSGWTADKRATHTGTYSDDTNGQYAYAHGEGIYIDNEGSVYALVNYSTESAMRYAASKIIKYDAALNEISEVELRQGDSFGRNANGIFSSSGIASYNGKLYIACIGGYQGPDSWGDIWEVDISSDSMSAKRILDGRDVLNNGAAAGMYGIQVTPQGTAFILTGSYSADYGTFTSRVLKIAMRDLLGGNAAQNLVTVAEYENAGYSWDILFDNSASTLWVMTGKEIEARDIDGKLLKTFSPFSLGDNAYTIALLEGAWVEYPELEPIEPNLPNTPGNNTPENNTPENNITAPVFIEATDESVSSFKDNTGIPVSVVEVAGTKQVVVDEDYAREAVKSVYSGSAEVTEIISLPAFRADAGGKEFVTVGYSLKGVSFLADYAKDASLLKILPDRKAAAYTYDASGTGGDGTFRILKDGNDYTGPLEAADIYDLALTLEDNGPYDLDKTTANTVLDPMIIARVAPVTGGSGGESGGGTGDGGGGGGCASGLGGGALLPVPFLLRLLKRSSRRRLRAIILKLKERKKRKEEGEQDEGQEKHDER